MVAVKKGGGLMIKLFDECPNCGHIEEDHAMDAPEGEQECNVEGCNCKNFESEEGSKVEEEESWWEEG